jgi:hypothetical protein
MPTRCNFLAQDRAANRFVSGVAGDSGQVLGIDPDICLAVMAVAGGNQRESAELAMDILLDDMRTNLEQITISKAVDEAPGLVCLRESLVNIEEYLREEQLGEVSLAAVQIDEEGRVSLAAAGDLLFYLRGDKVLRLSAEETRPLGATEASSDPLLVELSVEQAACLLLLTAEDEAAIGMEFVKLSLARFCNTPEMLLRQLSVRGQRNKLARPPTALYVSAVREESPKRGLLKRLRRR